MLSTDNYSHRDLCAYGDLAQTSRTGHMFDGWFTEQTGGIRITAEMVVATAEDHQLNAQWVPLSEVGTVTFDSQGGSAPDPDSKQVVRNRAYGELPATSRGPGYIFAGWYTEPAGGRRITEHSTVDTAEDHTLYARWTPHGYTVTFDPQWGSPPEPPTMRVHFDQPYGPLPVTSREGYAFAGWFTEPTGGTRILPTTIVDTDAERTLYALWGNAFTVTPTAGPGGSIAPDTPWAVLRNAAAIFTVNPDPGHTPQVAGTCGGNLAGTIFTTNPVIADCTVEATFSRNTYTVLVQANPVQGGTVSGGGEYSHGREVTVTAQANDDYVFTKWTEAGAEVSSSEHYTFTAEGPRTLTAHFRKSAGLPGVLMLLLDE